MTREGRRSAKLPELDTFASILHIEEEKKLVKDMPECYFNFIFCESNVCLPRVKILATLYPFFVPFSSLPGGISSRLFLSQGWIMALFLFLSRLFFVMLLLVRTSGFVFLPPRPHLTPIMNFLCAFSSRVQTGE